MEKEVVLGIAAIVVAALLLLTVLLVKGGRVTYRRKGEDSETELVLETPEVIQSIPRPDRDVKEIEHTPRGTQDDHPEDDNPTGSRDSVR